MNEDRRIGHLVIADEPYGTVFSTDDVRRRMSARIAYLPGRLDDGVVERLDEMAGAGGGKLRRLSCRELIGLLHEADRHLFGTPPVVRELRDWLHLTRHDPRYEEDGLTDRALDLSRWEALGLHAVLARCTYPLLRRVGLPRILAGSSREVLGYDGDVIVLIGPGRCDQVGQVAMGRVLMRQWLLLSGLGYATHPLSQIIDAPHTRERLARSLGIDEPDRLLNVARAGRPTATAARSARREHAVAGDRSRHGPARPG